MILSDTTIREYIRERRIVVLPEFDESDIRPTGIRLHLSENVLLPIEGQKIDLGQESEVQFEELSIPPAGYHLQSNRFILGSTVECIQTKSDIVCHLEGRSTIARLGLSIHCTSGLIDSNHDEARSIVLEIKNNGPFEIILRRRVAIAMLLFSELTKPISQMSQSQYKDQQTVLPPNLKYVKGS